MKTHDNTNHEPADSFTNLLRETIAGDNLPPTDPALREALLKKLAQPAGEPTLSVAVASRRRTFFQRAGFALASTAALALVAFLWQRPNLPVLGWNLAQSAPQAVRSSPNAPFDDDHQSFSVGLTPTGPAADIANDEKLASRFLEGRLEGNPTADYASKTWPKMNKRYGQGQGLGRGVGAGDRPESAEVPPYEATVASRTKGPAATPLPLTTAPSAESAPQPYYTTRGPRDYFKDDATSGTPPANESKPVGQPGGGQKNFDPAQYAAPALPSSQPAPLAGPARPDASGPATGGTVQLPTRTTLSSAVPQDPAPAKMGKEEVLKQEVDRLQELKKEPQIVATVEGLVQDAPKVREELREKFSRVVTLTDELNRTRARGEGNEQLDKRKLADLETAIHEVREVEQKYRAVLPNVPGEQYAPIVENAFQSPSSEEHALSTFSIDVDTASYANTRRFLNNGTLPPPDAVRIEELVNYFKYKYPQPKGDDPFSVNMEMADCPWHPGHKLLRVGLQGKEIHRAERPASNIVFLIDTSGSMTDANKLPLLKQAFTMLTSELGENDKVTIVTYAGNAGLKLEPTRGDQKDKIIAAIDSLQSGGSTHGSAGIALAYEQAAATFIKGGTNKVILATDGDLNVGITDDASLVNLIKQKAETGVFLTVLGVGTGNLKDAKMERLADNGNGIYAYLDSVREARKVLVEEMSGSLVTIAKDVKIQIEFNPAEVKSYRLLGYENRILAHQDFDNDKKDAGEIGAGHSVTAFYEVVLAGDPDVKPAAAATPETEPLRYQRVPEVVKPTKELTAVAKSGEILTLKLRHKKPEATESTKREYPLKDKGGNFNSASADFQFASAVVAFGLSLRNSEHRGSANLSAVAEIATAAIGEDAGGHRAEFLDLVRRAKSLRGE